MSGSPSARPDDLPRVGSVPYLNARPLVDGLADDPRIRYREEIPSRLAADLDRSDLDVALVSAIEVGKRPDGAIVGDVAITSDGPVESVILAGSGPIARARRIALDGASLCAAAAARVIVRAFHGRRDVEFTRIGPAPDPRTSDADLTLVIGDAALTGRRDVPVVVDLGEEWTRATQLPFTWAVWLAREATPDPRIALALADAAARGLARRDAFADRFAAASGIPAERARHYLCRSIRYALDERARAGLARFLELAREVAPECVRPGVA